MKLIFIVVGTLTSKFAVFGAQKTRKWSYRSQCTHYEWLFGTIGTYFFENEDSATITVNGDTYRTMITVFFLFAFHGIVMNDVWF